jgi:hypothetical protein
VARPPPHQLARRRTLSLNSRGRGYQTSARSRRFQKEFARFRLSIAQILRQKQMGPKARFPVFARWCEFGRYVFAATDGPAQAGSPPRIFRCTGWPSVAVAGPDHVRVGVRPLPQLKMNPILLEPLLHVEFMTEDTTQITLEAAPFKSEKSTKP